MLSSTLQMSYQKPDAKRVQTLRDIANKMRIHSVNMTQASNSGWVHMIPSSIRLSCALFPSSWVKFVHTCAQATSEECVEPLCLVNCECNLLQVINLQLFDLSPRDVLLVYTCMCVPCLATWSPIVHLRAPYTCAIEGVHTWLKSF